MNRLPKAMAALSAIPLLLALLLTATVAVALTPGVYFYQYNLLHQEQVIGCDRAELDRITVELIDYMADRSAELDTRAVIGGEERDVYLPIDRQHMADVKNLFTLARGAIPLGFAMFFALLLPAVFMVDKKARARAVTGRLLLGIGIFFALIAALAAYIALNFQTAFTQFHLLFFSNDLWLLPANSVLLQMMPTQFFINLASIIGALFGGGVIVIAAVALIARAWFGRAEKKTTEPIVAVPADDGERFVIEDKDKDKDKEHTCAEDIFERFGLSDEDDKPLMPDEGMPAPKPAAVDTPAEEIPAMDIPTFNAPAEEIPAEDIPAAVTHEVESIIMEIPVLEARAEEAPPAREDAPVVAESAQVTAAVVWTEQTQDGEPVTLRVPVRVPPSALRNHGMTLELSIQLEDGAARGADAATRQVLPKPLEPLEDSPPEIPATGRADQGPALEEMLSKLDSIMASLPEEIRD